MPRYVDADKTLDLMWNALYQYEDDMEKKHGLNLTERLDVQNGFEVAHKVVVDAPAEDVAPVVHAHWIYRGAVDDYHDSYTCSNCLCVEILTTRSKVSYCWNCGAKMDEVIE